MNLVLSKRIPKIIKQNSISKEIERLTNLGHCYIDLTTSNPTKCNFTYPKQDIIDDIANGELFHYQPNSQGSRTAREAIASYHTHNIVASDIVLTSSSSEAYSWLFKLLCDPGDEILVTSPNYPLLYWLATLEGVRVSTVPTIRHERWNIDLQSLEKALTSKVRALVIVNPNNPTGQFLSRSEWSALLSLCAKYKVALLVDEVFKDYVLEPEYDYLPTALSEIHQDCTIFIISGLSKVVALPQIKLSWIVAVGKQAKEMIKILSFIADQYLSVSTTAQIVAPRLLGVAPIIQSEIMQRMRTNLATLDLAIKNYQHITRLKIGGGWSVIIRRPATTSAEAFTLQLLKKQKVLVHPGYFFDLTGDSYIIISLLLEPNIFHDGVKKLLMATL